VRSRIDNHPVLALVLAGCLLLPATMALAGPYSQLQVLLPGESPAPGTTTGKVGSPDAQSVGIPFTVRVRAVDAEWVTQTGVTNVVSLSSTDAEADLPADTALSAGEKSFTVALNAAGSFRFMVADLSDGTIADATSASVVAQTLAGFEFQSITQKHRYAGQAFSTTITAVGPTGTQVIGYSGSVRLQELTSFGPGRITPEVVTLNEGRWSGNLTVYRADETDISSGNVNLYVHLDSDPTKNGTSNPFVVHPGPLSRLLLVLPGQTALPGSVSGLTGSPATQGATQPFTVNVHATDAWWNPLPAAHSVRVTSSDPAANTPVDGVLVDGHAQLSVSLGTFGAQTLTVSDRSDGSVQGMTSAAVQVISGTAHQFVVGTMPAAVTAGQSVSVTIRATDATGNTITNYQGDAILAANTGAGSISPESISFTGGVWTGPIVFRGAGGAVQFTCSDYATPPHFGTSAPFQVLPAAYAGLQVLLPGQTPRGGTADGVEGAPTTQAAGTPFQVRVRAVDAFFNRVSGVGNRIALTSTDANLVSPAAPALVNGEATLSVTVFRAGYQTISAADLDVDAVDDGTSDQVEVTPGAYARLLLLAPGQAFSPGADDGRSGEATDQSINFAFTVRVLAADQWFNPVAGVTDVVRLTSNDAMAEMPADAALVDGEVQMNVRLSTGGYQQITAANVTRPAILPSTTQVRAITSGLHLQAEISPAIVKAGEPFTLTVSVTNDAGAVIQEINTAVTVVVLHATTQEPGRGLLANTGFQLLQGQRTVTQTYTFAETVVFVISDEAGNAPARTGVLTVVPGDPAALLLSSDPSWVRAARTSTITARVEDAHGNGVPGLPVRFAVVLGTGSLLAELGKAVELDASTGDDGSASVQFEAPREAETGLVTAVSGALQAELRLETALVDPLAEGGTLTSYPNPFHPDEAPTTIHYVLDDDATVRMRIYTLSGGLVVDRRFERGAEGGTAGHNTVLWDGRNDENQTVASGGYILFIEAEGNGATMHVMNRKLGVVR
jgi:hypothetical protein